MRESQSRLLAALTAPAECAVHSVLDEALSRLPSNYRAALVLCYLQGMTNEEAARRLRWPIGKVRGRMARARRLLRIRLAVRGVRMSTAMLAAFLASERARAGSVPQPLSEATVRAGVRFVAGREDARAVRLADH
jgi:hypothetical protein